MLQKIVSVRHGAGWLAIFCLTVMATPIRAQAPGFYDIEAAASEIHWRIYKAGAFARFGHNHVIAIAQPSGTVELTEDIAESTLVMEFAVADLSIDDPALRSRYGEQFASEPTAEDMAGTQTNMLTDKVLSGDEFPTISLTGSKLSGVGEDQTIELNIALLGRSVALTVPVQVSFDDGDLVARADFRLMHEDLGMEPFSVMMGALQVAPEIDFTVDIRATRRSADTATAL